MEQEKIIIEGSSSIRIITTKKENKNPKVEEEEEEVTFEIQTTLAEQETKEKDANKLSAT